MKTTLLASLLTIAMISSTSVFAQGSDAANAPVTRAQVKAELVAAEKNGQLDVVRTESYPQLLPYQAAQDGNAQATSGIALTQANPLRVRAQ